eukprot:gene6474-7762_t
MGTPVERLFTDDAKRREWKERNFQDLLQSFKAYKLLLHPDKKRVKFQLPSDIRLAYDNVTAVESDVRAMLQGYTSARAMQRQEVLEQQRQEEYTALLERYQTFADSIQADPRMKKDAGAIMEFLNLPQDFDPKVFLTEAKMGEKELKKKGASKVLSILAWLETLTSQLTGPVKDNMLSEPVSTTETG